MVRPPVSPSGTFGSAGRVRPVDDAAVRTGGFRLAGAPLPVLGVVRVYTCGITPYDVTHLGHAATFVWADVLAAVLTGAGTEVRSARNVTDVDDVLTRAAGARGRRFDEFALGQEYLFEQDMQALRVHRPTHEPRARHYVGHVQHLAVALLEAGAAYARDGYVYFRGAAALERSGLDRERALELAREFGDEPDDPHRDDPFDVPVWRPSGDADPAWPSPWGWGRPGWHAECAAMATATLGAGVDVLVGGEDLAFPHHAYQAAMVEAATAVRPFARRSLLVGAVRQDGAKMSKSRGNLTLVTDLLGAHRAPAVRLLLVDRPWGASWEYTPALLDDAEAKLDRLYAAAGRTASGGPGAAAARSALLDELDVPRALAIAEEAGGEAARGVLRTLALG